MTRWLTLPLVASIASITMITASCTGSETPAAGASDSTSVGATSESPTRSESMIIDVRTPEEFAAGHLEGAVNIDLQAADFADRIAALDPAASYVVYCRSGNRSGQAQSYMQSVGFGDVENAGSVEAASASLDLPIITGS